MPPDLRRQIAWLRTAASSPLHSVASVPSRHEYFRLAQREDRAASGVAAVRSGAIVRRTGGFMSDLSKAGLVAALLTSLLAARPAQAQIASRPQDGSGDGERRGIYLGLLGNGGVQLAGSADAKFGYGGQGRVRV